MKSSCSRIFELVDLIVEVYKESSLEGTTLSKINGSNVAQVSVKISIKF